VEIEAQIHDLFPEHKSEQNYTSHGLGVNMQHFKRGNAPEISK